MERLDYIMAIAEEQNITKAAERLFISQPALTKYLNKLEEDYGVVLFDRSRSPIKLTEAGRLFLSEKLKIESAEQNLRHRLELMKNARDIIKIGTGFARANKWIPSLLSIFCADHPDFDIEVNGVGELSLSDQLAHDRIDLAIGAFESWDHDISWTLLQEESLCLLIPLSYGIIPDSLDPESTIQKPYVINPSVLDGLDYVSPNKNMGSYDSYQILRKKYSIRIGRLITTNNSEAVRQMVLNGLGYSYCSIRSVKNLTDQSGNYAAACAILPDLPSKRNCIAAYKTSNPKSALLKEMISCLTTVIGNG